jgi:hypothetical protein
MFLSLCLIAKAADDEGFKPIFNGKNLDGWKIFLDPKAKDADATKTWTIGKDGEIQCHGFPNGYIYSAESFSNYVIRYDWMFPVKQPPKTTMNTGLLVHIQEPHAIWPKSVEPQGRLKDHGKLFFPGGVKPIGTPTFDDAAHKKAVKPQGEWNTTEVTCDAEGNVTVKINGVTVATGKTALTKGAVGFQSEGSEFHFKNIRVKSLK